MIINLVSENLILQATALLDCTNEWYVNIDKKMFNLVVFIDLKKAFDTVNHNILLKKLEFYGITGQAHDLLKSYLSNRHQKCQIDNFISSEHLIKCGVPQSSILGPLLFLLYINDLPECLKNTRPMLFTDDTNITATSHAIADIETAVNSHLENLKNWLIANKLSLNVAKTEFMLIGYPQMIRNASNAQPNILIENKQIQQVNKAKTLGIIIDQLYVVSNHLLLKEIRLPPYTMPLYVPTSTIVQKFGMYLVKYNQNDYKSSKTELLELFQI